MELIKKYISDLKSISWISYGILEKDIWIQLSYSVTLLSSLIVSFYKIKDKLKKNNDLEIQNNP